MSFQPDATWLGRILETISDFAIVLDPAGTIRYINHVEPGFDREEVVGASATSFLFPGSGAVITEALHAVVRTGEKRGFDVSVQLPDGSAACYRSQMMPLREEGRLVAVLILATNVTALKTAEATTARLKKLLPVCAWCDRIQTEDGVWQTLPVYLKKLEDTDVTHGLCPACAKQQMEEIAGLSR